MPKRISFKTAPRKNNLIISMHGFQHAAQAAYLLNLLGEVQEKELPPVDILLVAEVRPFGGKQVEKFQILFQIVVLLQWLGRAGQFPRPLVICICRRPTEINDPIPVL